jgi:hypothetical protein
MVKTETPRNENQTVQKKEYIKPVFSIVQLVPEEAVLGNCKFGSGAGVQSDCEFAGDLQCSSVPRS